MTRAELIAALKEAKGADRKLDSQLLSITTGADVWSYHDNCHIDTQIERGIWKGKREDHPDFYAEGDNEITWRYRIYKTIEYGDVPNLTSSLDAAIALVERVRPGWSWSRDPAGRIELWSYEHTAVDEKCFCLMAGAEATTPALALCIALLESMEAEGK